MTLAHLSDLENRKRRSAGRPFDAISQLDVDHTSRYNSQEHPRRSTRLEKTKRHSSRPPDQAFFAFDLAGFFLGFFLRLSVQLGQIQLPSGSLSKPRHPMWNYAISIRRDASLTVHTHPLVLAVIVVATNHLSI
jgi:hypothetical protein